MSAPTIATPPPPVEYQVTLLTRAAWTSGYRAGLAAAEAAMQKQLAENAARLQQARERIEAALARASA